MTSSMRLAWLALVGSGVWSTAVACSPGSGGKTTNGITGGAGGFGAVVGMGGNANSGHVLPPTGSGGGGDIMIAAPSARPQEKGDGPDGACAAAPFSAEQRVTKKEIPTTVVEPIDLYIMFDQSLSMTCMLDTNDTTKGDRWTAVKKALQGFVSSGITNVNVGIQYFGNNGLNSSCNAADYQNPDVEIGPLPQNTQPIVNSLNAHTASTNTPTLAGLQGALNHATAWQTAHPDDVVAVVLVTDGQPNGCGTVADVATAAGTGWNKGAGVRTFVVGIISPSTPCGFDQNPPNQADLDTVAVAGGTDASLIVDVSQGDPVKTFTDQLEKIRKTVTKTVTKTVVQTTTLACEFELPKIPDGKVFNADKVNVEYSKGMAAKETVYRAASEAECATTTQKAWYYDDPTKPTKILLCPNTCKAIQGPNGDAGSSPVPVEGPPLVNILLGCDAKFIPPA